MRAAIMTLASILMLALPAAAQETTFQDPLLGQLVGRWVLQGTIAGRGTTHDLVADWVLNHEYLRFHEVSREKDSNGRAAYEAIVFIGWDKPSSQYACLWLDSTGGGGLAAQAIGYAKRSGDELAFSFKGGDGSIFHTTFVYNRSIGIWQWLMDEEQGGKWQPFARLKLTRNDS